MSGISRFFYQNRNLITITGSRDFQRFIWGQGAVLASQNLQVAACSLLASDRSSSVLVTATQDDLMPQRYTVSGFPQLEIRDTAGTIAFMGYYWDSVLGAYAPGRGHRYYKPTLMRFMTADDLSPFAEGGVNAYAYCQGDPVNYIDPDGAMRHRVAQKPLMKPSSNATRPVSPRSSTPPSPLDLASNLSADDLLLPDDFYDVIASINGPQQGRAPGPVSRQPSVPARVAPYPANASRGARSNPPQPSPELLALVDAYTFTEGDRGVARMAFDSLYPNLTTQEKRQKIQYLKSQILLRRAVLTTPTSASSGTAPTTSGAMSDVRKT